MPPQNRDRPRSHKVPSKEKLHKTDEDPTNNKEAMGFEEFPKTQAMGFTEFPKTQARRAMGFTEFPKTQAR